MHASQNSGQPCYPFDHWSIKHPQLPVSTSLSYGVSLGLLGSFNPTPGSLNPVIDARNRCRNEATISLSSSASVSPHPRSPECKALHYTAEGLRVMALDRTKPDNVEVSDTLLFEYPPALSSLLRMPYSYGGILVSGENIPLFHMPLTAMHHLGHLSGSSVPFATRRPRVDRGHKHHLDEVNGHRHHT